MGGRKCQVEGLVINRGFWRGRRVFLTGHTGFIGAWMCLVLRSLGAEIKGLALAPDDDRNLFVVAGVDQDITHCVADIRNPAVVRESISRAEPEIVMHLAAQALVRRSFAEPVETYDTNVMGTVHVLEAVRHASSVKAALIITSDKCYENVEWVWGYRENDLLGGRDPYSNSKACAELVTDAYRRTFFQSEGSASIASARAGNVIGGGDWSPDRLVPDAVRAFMAGEPLRLRSPQAVRPWQHVLDPILACLQLAERLVKDGSKFADCWNFGPAATSEISVAKLADELVSLWGDGARWIRVEGVHSPEASCLKLDCSKAISMLAWRPVLDLSEALRLTLDWYQAFARSDDMRKFTLAQIASTLNGETVRDGIAPQLVASY